MASRNQLQVIALNCTSFDSKQSIIRMADKLSQITSLSLAAPGYVDHDDGTRVHQPFVGSAKALINKVYKVRNVEDYDKADFNVRGPELVRFWVITHDESEANGERFEVMISATMHTRQYSEATATFTSFNRDLLMDDHVLRILTEISIVFYRTLKPFITWLDFPPATFARLSDKNVLQLKLQELHWLNLFGTPYVEKYGKEFLMNAPVHSTRALEDGGVELRLGKRLDQDDDEVSVDEIIEYFKPAGLKYLAWPKEVRVE